MSIHPQHTYVRLADDGSSQEIPGDAFWRLPSSALERHGQGWLISEFEFTTDWPTWEMHPHGDEFVYLLSGTVELLLEQGDNLVTIALHGAGAVVVPRGVWHTAKVLAPSRMLHVTRGAGTETRPVVSRLGMSGAVYFEAAQQFRDWLAAHAHTATELLVGFRKVGSDLPSMRWPESVDQALCYGWIDGVRRRVDEDSYTIRFTPRQARSIWSAVNIEKVAALRAQGLMTPAGEAAFALRSAARSVVYAYEQAALAVLPSEAEVLFRQNAVAWAYLEACPPGYRRQVLHWVVSAKRQATRDARLARLIEACAAGRRLGQD